MPNVLVDRHHSGLYHSMQILAERFGWTLYTPTGHDWWDEWLWRFGQVYGDDRLAQQFLMHPVDDNEFPDWPVHFVTLAEAREMDWAYVIASVPDNEPGFAKFARESGAQYVIQVGNRRQEVRWDLNPLALVSSEVPIEGRGIRYHQPMDRIEYSEPTAKWSAASFVNCMTSMGKREPDDPPWMYDLLLKARRVIPLAVYGIDGPDGVVKPYADIIEKMRRVGWGWHDKDGGDGFGHVIHSWAAVGRPLVGHRSQYRGLMAEHLWQSSIDLDVVSAEEAVELILTISESEHAERCRAVRREFETIDWDAEADQIADLLGLRVAA